MLKVKAAEWLVKVWAGLHNHRGNQSWPIQIVKTYSAMIFITMTTRTTNFALSLSGNKELDNNKIPYNILDFDGICSIHDRLFPIRKQPDKIQWKKSIQQKKIIRKPPPPWPKSESPL